MGGPGSGRKPKTIAPGSNGARLAIEAIKKNGTYLSAVAVATGIDRSRLRRLLKGEGTPSLWESVALDELLGVPGREWLR